MGASASVQEQGRPWWDSARAVKEALEGGTWRQLLEQHKEGVNASDPHTGRTLLHEVLQPGCRGVAAAAEAVAFLVECGAGSVPDGEGRTPVWYALQHRDRDARSALLAALGEQVGKMQMGVASRLRHFLADEWPLLTARVAATADVARTASDATQQQQSQSQAQPAPQELRTRKPTDKDKTSERLQNHVDGRKICFIRNDAACETPLLEWLVQLLEVEPDLGYRPEHVTSVLLGLRFVVQRVLQRVEKAPDEIEDWMAVGDWFEHLCAGYLFTCDCVEYEINGETCDLVCNTDGVPIVKEYHKHFTGTAVLQNHGTDYVRPALYFGMNQAMRAIGLSEGARAARSVFELEPAPAQLHVIKTFQPLIAKLTRLIRSRRPSLTTVFRGIDRNVSAQYKVGTSVVWNAFTSTTREQGVAKDFMYGKAGTFFVIVAKQGAAEVGFASVFPQEAELLYDSNIEFRVQWKLSPTLLRMVGQPFDVIVMQEVPGHDNEAIADAVSLPESQQTHPQPRLTSVDTAYSVADQVEAVRKVLQHTASLFADFLDSYVEGRVGDDTHVPESKTRLLLHEVGEWLAEDGPAEQAGAGGTLRHPLCLVGDGGTGKTSAAVAVLCHLLQEDAGAAQRKKPVFPIFAALPAIGVDAITTRGGIDAFIQKSFGLEEAALEHLGSVYDAVVILDSLDEVGLTQEDLSGAYRHSGGQGVLRLHPWCTKCSVIVTTRGEYLKSVGHTASQVCGDKTRSLYMQPFTQADAVTYISKVRGAQVAKAEQQRVDTDVTVDYQGQLATVRDTCGAVDTTVPRSGRTVADAEVAALSQLSNPFLLHMACYAQRELSSCGTQAQQCLSDVAVYEAYLQKYVEVELRQGAAGARVEKVLRVGELIACAMLQAQMWQGVLGTERARLLEEDNVGGADSDEAFRLLPFRVENFEDDSSAFTFRHKTLGEFLVARRLARDGVAETLGCKVRRAFSQDAPNVLQYFADTVLARGGDARDTKVADELLPLVLASRTGGGDGVLLASASNAMALAVRTRCAFRCDLTGVRVQHSDLRHAHLCGTVLTGSRFYNCWLEHAILTDVNLTRSDWTGCSFGAPLPPLLGHSDAVYTVAVTPDGSKIISGSRDNSVRIWDASTGKELWTLEGHTSDVLSVTVTSDGSKIVSGSDDNSVRVWETATGKELQKLEGHACDVLSVAVTPDGSKIISGSGDESVRVWDASTGKELQKFEGHTSDVLSVAVVPDGSKVISGSYDKSVRVWDASTGKELHKLEGHTLKVNTVAFTPDGSKIISGSKDKSVRIWDASTGKELQKLEGHTSYVYAVAVVPDGSKVISGSKDRSVRVWDASTGRELQKFEGQTADVYTVAVTPDGSKIVSGSKDKSVRVWDASAGKELQKLEGHTSDVYTVAFTPDGSKIISGSYDKSVRVWDAATGKELHKLAGHTSDVNSVAVMPDGSNIISGSYDKSVRVWDTATGKELQKLEGHTSDVSTVAVAPDGSKIVSGSKDRSVRVWDASTGKELHKLEGHTSQVLSVTVTPDGSKIISGSRDNSVRVWDAATGKELQTLEGHTSHVLAVAVAPDGSKIISGAKDNSVRVWETATGKELQELKGHTSYVYAVAVTPDGSKIISGSKDNFIRVWDASTGKELQTLEGHTSHVYAVAVAPDGSKIASGSKDKSVRVWDTSTARGSQKLEGHTVPVCEDNETHISAAPWRLAAVLGIGPIVPVPFPCTGLDTVTPPNVCSLLGAATAR